MALTLTNSKSPTSATGRKNTALVKCLSFWSGALIARIRLCTCWSLLRRKRHKWFKMPTVKMSEDVS